MNARRSARLKGQGSWAMFWPRKPTPQLPRNIFLALSRGLIWVLRRLVYPLAARAARSTKRKPGTHLLIGAGERGWELIEYQEIFASAGEYLGKKNVSRLVFSSGRSVPHQLAAAIKTHGPTHYYFDARSGSQQSVRSLFEAVAIGLLLEYHGVVPICSLTDFPVRRWRLQTAIVSARQGVVTTLMSPSIVGRLYPHQRLLGPAPFALSATTLRKLRARKARGPITAVGGKVVFVGMLYEPRRTAIENIKLGLEQLGIPMEIIGRNPDGTRILDDDYWQFISDARLVISTSSQISGPHTDVDGLNHFVYRFIEATAAGTALASEPVDGSEHLLAPDRHYISFSSTNEAIDKIAQAWFSEGFLENLGAEGHRQTSGILESHLYWRDVFQALETGPIDGRANHQPD